LLTAAGTSLAVILALLVGSSSGGSGGSAPVAVGPDAVGVIDTTRNGVSGVVTGAGRPDGVAYGRALPGSPTAPMTCCCGLTQPTGSSTGSGSGADPPGLIVAGGESWVANEFDGTVSEVRERGGNDPDGKRPDAIASGYGSVWVANLTDNTLSRIDQRGGWVVATISLGSARPGWRPGPGNLGDQR